MFFNRVNRTPDGTGWQNMASAPRDGTVIELCCTYGVAPWYGLYRWTDTRTIYERGSREPFTFKGAPAWVKAGDDSFGVDCEESLHWRPAPKTKQYIDPTNGAQDTPNYWRRACGL